MKSCIYDIELDVNNISKNKQAPNITLKEALDNYISIGRNVNKLNKDETPLKREEFYKLITNTFHLDGAYSKNLNNIDILKKYNDSDEISSWALTSVKTVVSILEHDKIINDEYIYPDAPVDQAYARDVLVSVLRYEIKRLSNITIIDGFSQVFSYFKTATTAFISGGGLIFLMTVLSFLFSLPIKFKIKKSVIYIGNEASGKSALANALPNMYRMQENKEYKPTSNICRTKDIILNNIALIYETYDTPGKEIRFMNKHPYPSSKKIYIIVLAHTKDSYKTNIDGCYLEEQTKRLNDYCKNINRHKKKIEKIIFFINKCDILPNRYGNIMNMSVYDRNDIIKKGIYKTYFDKVNNILDENIKYEIVSGSTLNTETLRTLLNSLSQ